MAGENNWDQNPLLTVEHLTMRFGGLVAVGDLSFTVGRGDITALIGPNGAGKTTVFNCITGFYKPTEGRIAMRHGDGDHDAAIREVTNSPDRVATTGGETAYLLERMPENLIARDARVARTFQNIRLFGGMTVLENLMVAQHNKLMVASNYTIGGLLGFRSFYEARTEAVEKSKYWLDTTGLTERADDPAADLPYGDQRRLEIARAMCTDPHLLCLDEPAAGLNPKESADLNKLLHTIRRDHDTSILLIEHDMGVVMEISDHVVVLDYGQKISDGSPDHVKSDPAVIAAYLGVEDEEIGDVEEIADDIAPITGGKIGKPTKKATKKTAKPKASAKTASKTASKTGSKTATKKPAAKKTTEAKAAAAGKAKSSAKTSGGSGKAAAAKKPAAAKSTTKSGADGKPAGLKAARGGKADDLKKISGVGPKIEGILHGLGIYHFDQVAAWKKAEIDWVDGHLKFHGRITREKWVTQARKLAKAASKASGGKA